MTAVAAVYVITAAADAGTVISFRQNSAAGNSDYSALFLTVTGADTGTGLAESVGPFNFKMIRIY